MDDPERSDEEGPLTTDRAMTRAETAEMLADSRREVDAARRALAESMASHDPQGRTVAQIDDLLRAAMPSGEDTP